PGLFQRYLTCHGCFSSGNMKRRASARWQTNRLPLHTPFDCLSFPLLGPEPQNQSFLCYPVETELGKN
ncbi:MAG TPA: hypothetical protein VFL80_12810, partial [Thermoanaerobaculia bacterium]|nr:hypothetical protein [Thermoanaerobaculia bacterium]